MLWRTEQSDSPLDVAHLRADQLSDMDRERLRALTRLSRSRVGRLASSSASVGIAAMLQ